MKNLITKLGGMAFAAAVATNGVAASHSDAPMMITDPAANITDVYAFVGNNARGEKVLNLIMQTNPLEDPGNGVIFYKFDDDLLYSFHLAKIRRNSKGAIQYFGPPDMTFNIRFSSTYKNQGTILSYGLGTAAGPIQATDDARQNLTQTYTVELVKGNQTINLGQGMRLLVPPPNVGPRTTPNYYANGNRIQGATTPAGLPSYTRENIFSLNRGVTSFAGQREDGFFADTAGIFDFLGVRNPGKDSFSGFNVQAICLQVPIKEIISPQEFPQVGVYATTSRKKVTIRENGGQNNSGPWVQVSRMGNPLFNEVLVALRDKDNYNMTGPEQDLSMFKTYAENCEVAFLLNAVLGTNLQVNNRTDLVAFFIPDLLKVDLSTPPVRLAGQQGFSRLSVFGGDTVSGIGGQVPSGWPNGRRLGDDVVDIALTAVASGPTYSTITPISDNANTNDTVYDLVFPYAGTPHGGPTTTLH